MSDNKEEFPESVSLNSTQKIIDQMNNSICKIINENKKGTGFFVKIKENEDG